VKLTQTQDIDDIKSILCHPEIYDRIAEDGMPSVEEYEPELDGVICIMDEGKKGVMLFHWVNGITLECHVQVLPKYRNEAHKFGQLALEWMWDNTKATKVVAQIPELYPDVVKFAYNNGFQREGINESSYLKNGQIYSQVYLGLIRPEV
jgi:hypothetical protein